LNTHLFTETDRVPTSVDFIQNLIRDACQTTHMLFSPLPNDEDYIWTKE
jgi:hypothetical protein